MKRLILMTGLLAFTIAAMAQTKEYSMDDVIHRSSSKDTLYIVNFWATWCAPCVAELPEFDRIEKYYAGKPVKVLLVSLDFKEDHTFKLSRFLERKKITQEVVWLSDSDPNKFIPKVDNSWEGSIPATVIVRAGKGFKRFIEGSITERQITAIADKVLAEQ